MITKILGFRRGLVSAISRRYPHGKLLTQNSYARLLNPATLGATSPLVTSARSFRCDAHMNELPVPCVPWEPWYSDKQSFYNKVLVAGILWWLFSLGMMLYTDSIYLNWGPPLQPGPPSDEVEECDDTE
uniref:Deltamethrin resistance protein prag01 domain-containing protein n=1 Tax=Heliothis virescens TaxID=7102 RepID=A0A2A4K365_HELVI